MPNKMATLAQRAANNNPAYALHVKALQAAQPRDLDASGIEARLGLWTKSLFAIPNHLTEQWASEFLQLYPSANILVTAKRDFNPHNRNVLFVYGV